ncbi:MAG: outer membrane protein assembly factor BamA [Desulfobacteraceae bacterium]|nr:outer membrane protein assembly factor BamA [Desulfobacteraceae bacterium]
MRNPKQMCYYRSILVLALLMTAVIQSIWLDGADSESNTLTVLVLPVQVNAQKELSYLRNQIAGVLAQRLEKEGAKTITLNDSEIDSALHTVEGGLDQIRAMARDRKADKVIWGSFTVFDESFSLDLRLLDVKEGAAPQRFFAQGQRLEDLITITNDLGDQISLALFQRQMVTEIRIQGNKRIETDAILRVIKTKKNTVYKPDTVSQDLKAIYSMGYFDDVRAESQSNPTGLTIIFHLKEKPTVRRIKIEGNNYLDEDKIKDNLTISTGAILNVFKIRSNVDQIEKLYKEKNYHKAKVDYKITPLENNQADLEFIIEEGPKVYVTNIQFEGNKSFEAKALKKPLKVKEKGFFYWLTDSGDLDRAELDQDVGRLSDFYTNKGYINAKVGEPVVDIRDDGIQITFKIDEGQRFKVGKIDVTGDLILPKEELIKPLSITKETYFSREKLRNDVLAITDVYADRGYAYADVSPRITQNQENLTVDVTFDVKQHDLVYFEKIIITGNTRTRDKVIRRELRVKEQGLFSSKELKRSVRNLYTLEYFEDVKVDTLKGSADDKMTLKLDVKEKATGSFSFGVGYSSEQNLFFTGSITEHNLFGRGQTLGLTGSIGSRTSMFNLSFTEPYLFDTPLRFTANVYNQEQRENESSYTRKSHGGGVQFGYPVWDYTRVYAGYNLDFTDISLNRCTQTDASGQPIIDPVTGQPVQVYCSSPPPPDIVLLSENNQGANITSSVNTSLVYDSRDRTFNTTEGSKHSIYIEEAGLGGDIGFHKYIGQTMWFFPLIKPFIGFANAKLGAIYTNGGMLLPDYEKFYLGGINSMRGFGYHGIYVRGDNNIITGGSFMAQFNFEIIFPIAASAGVNGVTFYDMGNVYEPSFMGDLRRSAGVGIRWLTAIAPLRLEYGWILDPRKDEQNGQVEFSLGGSF